MPGGRESAGRRPKENNARRVKKNISKNGPGRRPKENNTRRVKRNISKNGPGRRPKKEQRHSNSGAVEHSIGKTKTL